MDILIFISGFALGGIAVYIPFFIAGRNEKRNTDAMFEQMKLQFENTANKVMSESSSSLSEQNSEKLEEFFKRFKEKIEDFEKRTEANFKTENENFTRFDLNIKSFIEELFVVDSVNIGANLLRQFCCKHFIRIIGQA